VTLFFPKGAARADPTSLLQGSGSQVRSIRPGSPADLDLPAVREPVAQASQSVASLYAEAPAHTMLVKSVSAKQRPRKPAAPAARTTRAGRRARRCTRPASARFAGCHRQVNSSVWHGVPMFPLAPTWWLLDRGIAAPTPGCPPASLRFAAALVRQPSHQPKLNNSEAGKLGRQVKPRSALYWESRMAGSWILHSEFPSSQPERCDWTGERTRLECRGGHLARHFPRGGYGARSGAFRTRRADRRGRVCSPSSIESSRLSCLPSRPPGVHLPAGGASSFSHFW
jgi:hypothetical protein